MFYVNAKLNAFKLPDLVEIEPAGGIIAASAMPCGVLQRRSFIQYPYLRHRMFDPQLYLAGLDPNTAKTTIFKLSTYKWFGVQIPEYESAMHETHAKYKQEQIDDVAKLWPGRAPTGDEEVYRCVSSALAFQIALGCESLIIPSPMTANKTSYALEAKYLDAAAKYVREKQVKLPLLATVMISDALLRGFDPLENKLIETITGHIAARREIAGAYVSIEQSADTGYACVNEDALFSLFLMVDDLTRGASKRVVVNYLGFFGLILTAAGADMWASGFYRSQRRMRLADQEEQEGRSYPRFFSRPMLSDVGVEKDLSILYRTPSLFQKIFSKTKASAPLAKALQANGTIAAAPGWLYKPGNIAASAAHYLDVCSQLDAYFDSFSKDERPVAIERWLEAAVETARTVSAVSVSNKTDVMHQKAWLGALRKWKDYRKK